MTRHAGTAVAGLRDLAVARTGDIAGSVGSIGPVQDSVIGVTEVEPAIAAI
jgi:hypothetical protein